MIISESFDFVRNSLFHWTVFCSIEVLMDGVSNDVYCSIIRDERNCERYRLVMEVGKNIREDLSDSRPTREAEATGEIRE